MFCRVINPPHMDGTFSKVVDGLLKSVTKMVNSSLRVLQATDYFNKRLHLGVVQYMRLSRQQLHFFYINILSIKKALKCKTNDHPPLRRFCVQIINVFVVFFVCLILFCWLVLVWFAFLCIDNLLSSKTDNYIFLVWYIPISSFLP